LEFVNALSLLGAIPWDSGDSAVSFWRSVPRFVKEGRPADSGESQSKGCCQMLDPRKTNVALDANALDRNGDESDALVARLNALVEARTLKVVVAFGVRAEVQHPRTPAEVKDAVLPRIYNLCADLNATQHEQRRRVAAIMQGDAKPGAHAADASHISEAAETGCAYFITHDKRILAKRPELGSVLPTLKIVTLVEFLDGFDRMA
jgi:hypothetical protein